MPVTAKICGLSTATTLDAAIAQGASHVGFVVFPPSPRHLGFEELAGLAARVPAHVRKVGVFVDPADDLLMAAVAAGRLDAIQLHKTTPARVAHLRRLSAREAWAAVAIETRGDLAAAAAQTGAADRLLYDAKTPEGATLPGGMGVRFDWELLRGFRHPLPWALSGGLDVTNVDEAIARTGTTLVDVSSGVESAPGVKDVDKIAAFLQRVSAS
ncbi:phosphoribosylanthranilate isomerase [Sphingomonas sp. BE138]|uniref:phosphoribosylanthranilate isomerase n=1 Tax=Sphingomonas sp. BE138 TaxID=2817845 RepID=UPI00285551FE|nr:phosphoribosylanthranilate isomerase [Sphingomonas sp. BE138]MDR6789518.1 phosphoribosylanthranilate isomerase [Sphingomonas sp. BE138]